MQEMRKIQGYLKIKHGATEMTFQFFWDKQAPSKHGSVDWYCPDLVVMLYLYIYIDQKFAPFGFMGASSNPLYTTAVLYRGFSGDMPRGGSCSA